MAINVANNQSLTAITALPSAVSGGAMTLLETQTTSSSATISFTSGSDVTMSDDMKTYRQDLRDLPSGKDTVDKVNNATFPTKP